MTRPESELSYPLMNAWGEPRRLGVELELAGLDLDQLLELIEASIGGKVKRYSDYEAEVIGTRLGTLRVEFDAAVFREHKVKQLVADLDPGLLDSLDRQALERTLAGMAQWVVPFELVFDPLPLSRISELEAIRQVLSEKALGTSSSMLYAFGLHLNMEPPNLEPETILSYLRAFLVLYEKLKHHHDINPARKLSGFIAPFPREYAMLILDTGYQPDLTQMIDDYLTLNPTRNRPLDLLPLWSFLDEPRVRARLPDEKIHPRPAFHYRLPDSRVDESDWSITREVEVWLRVETLANHPRLLAKRCRYELKRLRGPFWYWLRRAWRTKPLLSRRPLIAVTGPDRGGFVAWACTWLALRRVGARAIWLKPGDYGDDPYLPPFDGLILGGGADVDPGRYLPDFESLSAEERQEDAQEYPRKSWPRRLSRWVASGLYAARSFFSLTSYGVDYERGEFEETCLAKALREDLPVLGICRGAQFLNVTLGGDLYDDIKGFYSETGRVTTVLPTNLIEVDEASFLGHLLGRRSLRVNSLHHQAIRRLASGLRVCARDRAGMIQAVESMDHHLWLGVQWHPEYLITSKIQQKIFHHLVQEASARKL